MRKSTSIRKSRLAYAGASIAAVGAAVFVAPTAAFAAVEVTGLTPSGGPAGTVVTVTGGTGTFTTTTPAFVLTNASTCPSTYTATISGSVAVAATSPGRTSETQANFTVPSTLAAGRYAVCAYAGTAAPNNGLLNGNTTPTAAQFYTVVPTTTLSPVSGASGGGNTITLTLPATAPLNTNNTAVFTPRANTCTGTYGSPTSGTTATITPASGSTTSGTVVVPVGVAGALSAATPYSVCIYSSGSTIGSTTALTTVASAPYNVSLPAVTLNNTVGAGGNGTTTAGPNLTLSSATNFLTGVTTAQAIFSTAACPATNPGATGSTFISSVLKTANNRAAVQVPIGAVAASGAPTQYNVCVYSDIAANSGRLLANAQYTAAVPPNPTGVTPASGSSLGGDTITVTGTNFPTAAGSITATLGGLPLTNVTPVDANTFTAVTPSHAAETNVPLVVTTSTGTTTLTSAFSFVNGISIAPNTAPNTATSVWVDVRGVGFSSLGFDDDPIAGGGTPTLTAARVFLVDARGACTGNTTSCVGTNAYAPASANVLAECSTPAVISDNELFCQLNLAAGAINLAATPNPAAATITTVPNGTYTLTVVNNGSPAASPANVTQSVISSGSTFTVAPF